MPVTPNISLPYMTATQSGKEVTYNQGLDMLDAVLGPILAAMGQGGSGSSLTPEQLAAIFIGQPQLETIINAALATLPTPLTLAQLQAELAALPAGSSGVTLAQLQTELAGLTVSAGGLVPGMAQLFHGTLDPVGFQRITPVRDFSRSRISGGPDLATVSTSGGAPAAAVSGGLTYSVDNVRGFYSYSPDTGAVVTLASPPMAPFSAAQKLALSHTGVVGAELLCVVSDTLNTAFAYFNATTGAWSEKTTLAEGLSLSALVPTGTVVLGIGGSASTGYVARSFSGASVTTLDCTGGWPSSYYAPALSCPLPSGAVLVAMRPTAGAARAQSCLLSIAGSTVSITATANGLPAEVLNVVALHRTSYGAAALVTLNNTAAPYQYALALFNETAGTWTLLPDRLGTTAMAASATLAVQDTDLGVVVFCPSNSGPAAFLASVAQQPIPELFYAVKMP